MNLITQIFENDRCYCRISRDRKYVQIKCYIKDTVYNNEIRYYISSPPDFMYSYNGSGLPFPNKEVAYWNSRNNNIKKKLKMDIENEKEININYPYFELISEIPNSYYNNFELIKPEIIIKYISNNKEITLKIPVDNRVPYRSLIFPKNRNSPEFYNIKLPVRTQEQILLDSKYPSTNYMYNNFWGLKPPV
jgi:hypothetical protein